MSNVVRVRVELKKVHSDPEKNFKLMLQEFKKRVDRSGFMRAYNEHEYFESPSQKKRRKSREAKKKYQLEMIEEKMLRGESVNVSPGLIKKSMASGRSRNGQN